MGKNSSIKIMCKFDVLVLQNSVVVMQNNGKERQKACCTCKFVFLLFKLEKKVCCTCNLFFLLIRSVDLDAIFIALHVEHYTI